MICSRRCARGIRGAASTFVVAGFAGTSMDDVAQAAGVSRLIVYRIFDSKEALYTALLDQVTQDLGEQFQTDDRRNETVVARVVAVASRHPDGFRLLWRHAVHEPEFAELASLFRSFVFDFAEQLLAPEIDDDLMRRWASRAIASYLYEGVCLWLDEQVQHRDQELVMALSTGIRAMVGSWQLNVRPGPGLKGTPSTTERRPRRRR